MTRKRLRLAITSTRPSGVLDGWACGAEERSSSPSPSDRQRASHFEAVRSLTPAASAAFVSDHPSPRCAGPEAVGCSNRSSLYGAVSSVSSLWLVASTPPSLQGGPDE